MSENSHKRFTRLRLNASAALLLPVLAAIIAAAIILGAAPTAQAQRPPLATPTPAPETDPGFPLPDHNPPLGNLDSILSRLVERVEQGITAADVAADALISRGDSVAVTFYTQGDTATLAAFLRANGGDPRIIGERYVEAYVPITLLVAASERPGVIRAQAIVPPQPAADAPSLLETINAPAGKGNVISQGGALHGADAWHAAGYTGAGVKVGVLAPGFAGFAALMGSELPSPATAITARCYTGISEFTSNLDDCQRNSIQGTAAAESLLDIAPDASLYISNPLSLGAFRDAVDWMVSQGVDVINYPAGWSWDGPGNGASPYRDSPLQAVDAAVDGGAIFVTAAGNFNGASWLGPWADPDADRILNFGANANTEPPASDELNGVSLDAQERLVVFLRWQDSWGGATTDLNLTLYNADGDIVASSADTQSGDAQHVPIEGFSFVAPASGRYDILVSLADGGAPPDWAQLQTFTRQALTFPSAGGSIGNPAESANPGMLAVGAAHYRDAHAIAEYSSRGPAPDGRTKPDITGADCAQVAALQATNLPNGRQCWSSGTSQASAHVAGLAALVKQRFPNYAPAQIADYLKANAQPRGAAKPNNAWGHGFAMLPAPPEPPLAGRVSAIEQQMGMVLQLLQNLQSLIQALTNRVAALEGGTAPLATPTATATPTSTPSPTPTSVPGTDPPPVITPVGDACIQSIQPGATAGAWATACVTANAPDDNTYYAKFYTFTLDARAEVTITLFATTPTYLYLLSGAGTDGNVEQEAGDPPSPTTTLTATLLPGNYTIEATTYNPNVTDDFTIELTIAP